MISDPILVNRKGEMQMGNGVIGTSTTQQAKYARQPVPKRLRRFRAETRNGSSISVEAADETSARTALDRISRHYEMGGLRSVTEVDNTPRSPHPQRISAPAAKPPRNPFDPSIFD